MAAGLIVLAAVAVYHNSFAGVFIYDDEKAIVENGSIRRLWPLGPVLSPPPSAVTAYGRPVLNLSLAVNYALGQLNVWGYHAVNLAIHTAAALLLFGIVRRTLLTPSLCGRFGDAATSLALLSALFWTVHPLQTESVTYIAQRAESLAGLFYLLTLYCVIRGADCEHGTKGGTKDGTKGGTDSSAIGVPQAQEVPRKPPAADQRLASPPGAGTSGLWYAAAVVACLLGMGCKEVMVTAPLVMLLYDRTFLAGTFVAALRRRWLLYSGLAATWGLLFLLMRSTGQIHRQLNLDVPNPWLYAMSQPGAILYYLRLTVWPSPLCLDYPRPPATTLGEMLPGAIAVALIILATVCGLTGRRVWGFLGAWFLLILLPTSSILPLNQLAFEHRMYLSLAAVTVLAVTAGYALWNGLTVWPKRGYPARAQKEAVPSFADGAVGKNRTMRDEEGGRPRRFPWRWAAPLAMCAAALVALGYATVVRNRDYHSAVAIWQDTVKKSPDSAIAHNNLGAVLTAVGKDREAFAEYQKALQLKPNHASAHSDLGNILAAWGKTEEAMAHYQRALAIAPDNARTHNNLGLLLGREGRLEEAVAQLQEALRLMPEYALAHNNVARFLFELGRTDEAIDHYRQAVRLRPDYAEAHDNLGVALFALGRTDEAIGHFRQALQASPGNTAAHQNLGNALARSGRIDEAVAHWQQAAALSPRDAAVQCSVGNSLAGVGRVEAAIEYFQRALQLDPRSAAALNDLAWLLATREHGGDPQRAVELAEQARAICGDENAPCLDTLAAAYAAAGRFDDAAATAQRAAELAASAGRAPLAAKIRARLQRYRAREPYRQ